MYFFNLAYLDFNDVLLVSLDLVQINGTKNKLFIFRGRIFLYSSS
jgi:hypothetical protein